MFGRCVQYAAFSVTPFFGSAVSYYGHRNSFTIYFLPVNEYSAPAVVTIIFSIICVFLLLCMPTPSPANIDGSVQHRNVDADSVFFDYSRHYWQKYIIIAGCVLNSILKVRFYYDNEISSSTGMHGCV